MFVRSSGQTIEAVDAGSHLELEYELPLANSFVLLSNSSSSSSSSRETPTRSELAHAKVLWRYRKALGVVNASASEIWKATDNTLVLHATGIWQAEAAAGSLTTVSTEFELPLALGLRLPAAGLVAGAMSVSSDSRAGAVAPTLGWSPGVGAFHLRYCCCLYCY